MPEAAPSRLIAFYDECGDHSLEKIDRDFPLTQGTRFIPAARFQRLNCPISFRRKTDNIAGLQIADLCAHPAARRVLNPAQPNQAWDLVCDRIYQRGGITGWKIFP
jgi:hypothetical protein